MKKPSKILYFGKKALAFLLSVLVLSLAVFYVSRLAPGDPLVSYYGDRAEKLTPQERAQAEEKLGLDEPIFTQYVRWAQNALHGDFGISYKYKMPAAEVIASRAGNTLLLGGIGFVLIFTLSLLLGMLCARREGTIFDRAVCKLGTITSCIPEFWLSLLLILIFAIELRVLPSSGAYSIGQQNNIADRAAHLILPLAVVVLGHLWYYAYMIRNRLLDEMQRGLCAACQGQGANAPRCDAAPLSSKHDANVLKHHGDLRPARAGRDRTSSRLFFPTPASARWPMKARDTRTTTC